MTKVLHIGIIAPAGALADNGSDAQREAAARAAAGLDYLTGLGCKVTLAANIRLEKSNTAQLLYTSVSADGLNTAGTVEERLKAVHEIYANPEIDIVLSLRGGYGSMQLLEQLDYSLIRKSKKPLLGYSDLTAMFMAFAAKSKQRSYHSPMLYELSTMSQLTAASFKDLIELLSKRNKSLPRIRDFEQNPVSMKIPKKARILGGNLSLIAALAGSKYLPKFKGAYLLIEDCNEPSYKIDRMFEQLRLAGVFRGLRGILVGAPRDADISYRVLEEIRASAKIPLLRGVQVGHGPINVCLPIN